MKIGIFVSHPTQFEGPFYRYASSSGEGQLRVIYTNPERLSMIHDSELKQDINWGIDLISGYEHNVCPERHWLKWLFAEIRDGAYDLIIVSGYNSKKYLAAALFAKILKVKCGLRIDSVLFNQRSKLKLVLKHLTYKALFMLYDHFFAVGSLAIEYLRHFGVHNNKISLFTYAIDDQTFSKYSQLSDMEIKAVKNKFSITNEAAVVLSVAKFNEREAPWDLLKAFCLINDPSLQLVLVGDGPQRAALETYAARHSVNVIFTGYLNYTMLPQVYAVADIFVHPSQNEPWGVSVAEAMACGLIVITSSNVGAGYDLIEPGVNGFLYISGDALELSEKILAGINLAQNQFHLKANQHIFTQWGYEATWKNILTCCRKSVKSEI